ncbi:MAG TPA: MFS transporter, partial [Thermodesulfobacteriota bacterium]|nr:MFS transporter [Thermodesulfobacteriota bacterium]
MIWLLLINAMLGQFLSGLSARIFQISLPTVAQGLATDILGVAWALIAFQLAGVSLSVVFGRLGDLYGRSRIYGLGFVLITISSVLCGLSRNVVELIAFRFLQGVGAAMTQSMARALAMEAAPEGGVGKAQGLMTSAYHTGFLLGPTLGGLLIEYVHWRAVFFFLAPVAAAGVALTVARARRNPEPRRPAVRLPVDYAGAALLIVLGTSLTLLLDRRTAEVAGAGLRGMTALVFVAALVGFVVQERRAASPIVHFPLFRIRMFAYSVLSLLLVAVVHGLVGFLMPFYLQEVLRLPPSIVGLLFLVPPLFTITLATFSGHLSDRLGPRIPATIGVLLMLAAALVGTGLRADSHWGVPTLLLGLTGLSVAFFNTPNHTAIIGSVPREYRGFATGIIHTMFGLGHLLGVSGGGALLALAFRSYAGLPGATPTPAAPAPFTAAMNVCYAAAAVLSAVALATSVLRGGEKVAVAHGPAPAGARAPGAAE